MELDPKNLFMWIFRANEYYKIQNYEGTLEDYEHVLRVKESDFKSRYLLQLHFSCARIHFERTNVNLEEKLKEFELFQAVECLNRITKCPNVEEAKFGYYTVFVSYFYKYKCYVRLGRPGKAYRNLIKAKRSHDEHENEIVKGFGGIRNLESVKNTEKSYKNCVSALENMRKRHDIGELLRESGKGVARIDMTERVLYIWEVENTAEFCKISLQDDKDIKIPLFCFWYCC